MSDARTSNRSTGVLEHGTMSAWSFDSKESPAAAHISSAGSARRPFDGTARLRRPFAPARAYPLADTLGSPLRASPIQRRTVSTRSVVQPVGDAGHGCGACGDELRDFEIRQVLIEEHNDPPSMRERFEFCDGAQIAQEATVLVLCPKR